MPSSTYYAVLLALVLGVGCGKETAEESEFEKLKALAKKGDAHATTFEPLYSQAMTSDQIAKAEALVKEMTTKNPKLLR